LIDKDTSTYTYILSDPATGLAVIIDPVLEQAERDLKLLHDQNLKLTTILETHMHADHTTGAGVLKKHTGANIGVSENTNASGNELVFKDGDKLSFGKLTIICISTPGHTNGCMSYLCEGNLFTGDTLMINGCGRTDFQEGSSDKLFHSVREKLFKYPDNTVVYPAHDYKGLTSSTIFEQKKTNPRLGLNISKDEFITIMENLKLSPPKNMEENLPRNLKCGFTSND
jgi:glyoxylase-like metal-dependent hydrolase (beta-lactamase superfamily II)